MPSPQRGVETVEFAMLVGLFLAMVFLVIEMARVMYVWNTAQDITRQAAHAAASTDFSDAAQMLQVQQQALPPGAAQLGGFSAAQVHIDYLSAIDAAGEPVPVATLAACPTRNLINCTNAPHGGNCARLVRARLCQNGAGAACPPVQYQPLLPLLWGFGSGARSFSIPSSDTVVAAGTLGYLPGMASCP